LFLSGSKFVIQAAANCSLSKRNKLHALEFAMLTTISN